ncbi:MAG TPA: hypothetical protein VGM88_10320 [Kofleriaceae bacterium]
MKRALLLLILLAGGVAHAEPVVGLFAPSAPFSSTASRVELVNRLAADLGKALGGKAVGRVYARAGDFAAAVKKGEVTVAVVDPGYLAAAGGGTVVAVALRGGEAAHGWQLVAKAGTKLADLRGKRILVPGLGGRETDFVLDVLLGGEVARDYFAKIEPAPDTVSALAALGLGKADAAVVPGGVDAPAGYASMLALPSLPEPVLVAYAGVPVAARADLVAAATAFHGDAIVAGFRGSDADGVRGIARRFSAPVKRGPFAVPAVRLLVGDLVEGRVFTIDRTSPTAFVAVPPAPQHP